MPILTHPPNQYVNILVFQRGKHTIAVSFTELEGGYSGAPSYIYIYMVEQNQLFLKSSKSIYMMEQDFSAPSAPYKGTPL